MVDCARTAAGVAGGRKVVLSALVPLPTSSPNSASGAMYESVPLQKVAEGGSGWIGE